MVVPNKRCATLHGLIGEPTHRDGAIFSHDRVALSLVYARYTALSAPCPAKKWPPSMGIRIVLTGPNHYVVIRIVMLLLRKDSEKGRGTRDEGRGKIECFSANLATCPSPLLFLRSANREPVHSYPDTLPAAEGMR